MKTNLILCPVDYSSCSHLAIELAGRLARCSDGVKPTKVILLHISDVGAEPASLVSKIAADTQKLLRDKGKFDAATKLEYLTLKGKPSTLIVEYAKKKNVDLIVMGSRGQSTIKKLMVGSVAESVMQNAHCPVIVTNHPKQPALLSTAKPVSGKTTK